jgi:hypothetical protein
MLAALRLHDESLADPRSNRLDQQPGCARNEARSIEPHLDCIRRPDRSRRRQFRCFVAGRILLPLPWVEVRSRGSRLQERFGSE